MTGPGPRQPATPSREDLVRAYKALLQSLIDRRPSGMRLRIAEALGKHKSFVSQITNPAYPVPVPARHISTIFEICHFAPEERESFLKAYAAAHPEQCRRLKRTRERPLGHRTLHIEVPLFDDPKLQHEVEDMIRQFAARIVALADRD